MRMMPYHFVPTLKWIRDLACFVRFWRFYASRLIWNSSSMNWTTAFRNFWIDDLILHSKTLNCNISKFWWVVLYVSKTSLWRFHLWSRRIVGLIVRTDCQLHPLTARAWPKIVALCSCCSACLAWYPSLGPKHHPAHSLEVSSAVQILCFHRNLWNQKCNVPLLGTVAWLPWQDLMTGLT